MSTPTPAKVQDLGSVTGGGSTVVLTLSGLANPTTVGNVLVLYSRTGTGAAASTVTDSKSNTWTVNEKGTTPNVNSAIASTFLTASLGNGDTITFTPTSAQANAEYGVAEFKNVASSAAGVAAVAATATNTHSTASPITIGANGGTTTKDLVISAVAAAPFTSAVTVGSSDPVSGGTWSQLASISTGCGGAYQVGSGTASNFSAGWTVGGTPTNIDASSVAFIAALGISTLASNVPGGSVGTPYSFNFSALNGSGTRTWSISGGPAGLSFTGSTLSGTPTTAGTSNATVTVTDTGGNSATLPVTITIAATGFSITTASPLTGGTKGTAYGPVALATTGGTGTVKWSLQSGVMPPGLNLSGSTTTSQLFGCTFATGAKTNNPAWSSAVSAVQWCKLYYTPSDGFPAPATLADANSDVQAAVANGTQVFLCYHLTAWGSTVDSSWQGDTTANKPSSSVMNNEQTALLTSIQAHLNIGLNVKAVVFNQELDGSKTYIAGQPKFLLTGPQATYPYYWNYKAVKKAFPAIDVAICYVDFSVDTPTSRAAYFPGPTQTNTAGWGPKGSNGVGLCYVDGIILDAYADVYVNTAARHAYSTTPATSPNWADIADYNGIKFGWGEAGNSATGNPSDQAHMTLYLSASTYEGNPGDSANSIEGVMAQRIANNLPNYPVMWYENGSSSAPGFNNIDISSTTTDYRIGMLQGIAATLASHVGGQIVGTPNFNGTYSFTLQATDSTGAVATKAFSLTIGTGSNTLAFTSSGTLPTATVGVEDFFQFRVTGGTAPYSFSVLSGSLPAGESITDTVNGVMDGTPTTPGNSSFTMKVTDSASNTATLACTQQVVAQSVTGQPYFAGGTNAPSGGSNLTLTVPIQTAVNSGDFLQVGVMASTAQTISVSDTAGNTYSLATSDTTETGAQLYIFEVDGAAPLSPVPDPISGKADSIAVTYSSNTSAQWAIAVGDNGTVARDKLLIAHGSSAAPSTGSTGTLATTEEHAITFIADQSPGGLPTFAAPFAGNVLDTESVSSVGRLTAAYAVVNTNAALTASATITSAPWTAGISTFEVNPPAITGVLSDGVQGDPYSQTLGITGGVAPYTSSLLSGVLPQGLTLASNVISGTPIQSGSFPVTIQVTDTNGVAATTTQTITIAPSTINGTPGVTLASNILTPADCDFESGVGSWVSASNASGIATSGNAAVTGLNSLSWRATANGSTSVQTGFYTGIQGGAPYVVSGYMLSTSNQSPNLWIGVNWYDSTGTLITSGSNNGVSLDGPLGWQPLQAALTAPSNAAKAKVFVIVDAANAGDVSYLDTVFFAKTNVQILADWTNPPFESGGNAAGNDFMDLTPFARLDQNITMSRGRQDMMSDVPPGSASFFLQNDTGMFTANRLENLPEALGGDVNLQARCQINVADNNGNWWTRFDGQVSEIDYTFDSTGNTSLAQINLTDILGYMNRSSSLWCWTKEQVLADNPQWHWTLDDAGNAGNAGVFVESSGNNGPALRLANSDNTNTNPVAFRSGNGGIETLADAALAGHKDGSEFWVAGSNVPNSQLRGLDSGTTGPYTTPLPTVYLTPKLNLQSAQNQFVGNVGYQLQTQLPTPITPNVVGQNYSVETWFTMDPGIATNVLNDVGPYTVLSLGTAREGTCLIAAIYVTNTSTLNLHVQTFSQPPAFLGKNYPGTAPPAAVQDISTPLNTGSGTNGMDKVQIPHHLVINFTGDPLSPVVTVWLDGQPMFSSFTLPKSQYYNTICLGGAFGGTGCHWGGLALASVYNYQLSAAQIADHCMLGQYGVWEQPTDDAIARLANYASIPPFWNNIQAQHNGLTLTDYQDITGSSPLSAMQIYEQAEQGFIFVDHMGALNFHTRDWRMGYQSPDLVLPPDVYTADIGYQIVDQYMQNESAIATQTYPTGAAYTNAPSQALYGPYITNPPQSPTQLPLTTFDRSAGQLGLPSFGFNPDPNLNDIAAWQANVFGTPFALPNSLTVDLLTLDPTSGLTIASFYALEIDNVIAPDMTKPLPQSFPDANLSLEWFIEGVTEVIGLSQHTIQFYTSPAEAQRAWIPGDPVYGVLGSTARVGISAADVSQIQADGKDVAHDSGEPYWPPTFAAGMNNLSGTGKGFIGNLEMRGLIDPLSRLLNPPMCIVSAIAQTQSLPAGSNSVPQIFWDTVHVDTEGGMGLIPGWPNWYVCTVPGYYDIDGCLTWSTASGTGNSGNMGQAWIVVAQKAAQALAAGTGGPDSAPQYVFPVGESPRWNGVGVNTVDTPTTRVYLGLGDMVSIAAEQNTASAQSTGTNLNGSHLSILFRGFATNDDGARFNTSIASGGTVSDKPHVTTFIKTYANTHTYSYFGPGASPAYGRRFSNPPVIYQASLNGNPSESQTGQIAFPFNTIHSDLNPGTGTVSIKSCTLTGTNIATNANTRNTAFAAFGYSSTTPGQSTFNASSEAHDDVKYEAFQQGQTVTTPLPLAFATAFQNNAKMIFLGDAKTVVRQNYGEWRGGPGSWLLTIEYTVTV